MRFRRRYEVVVQGESGSAISQYSVISEHRNERDAREAAALERRRLEMIRAEEAASWVINVMRGDEVIHEERPFGGRRDAVPVPPLGALGIRQRDPADETAAGSGPPAEATPDEPNDTPGNGTRESDDAGDQDRVPAEAASGEGGAPGLVAPGDAPPGDGDDEPEGARTGTIPAVTAAPAAVDEAAPDTPSERRAEAGDPSAAPDRAHAAFDVPDDIVAPDEADPVPAFLAEPASGGENASGDAGAGETGRTARVSRDADIPSGRVPDDVIRRFEEAIARERERERERGGGGRS
jgi:hypothetical protein